MTHALDFDVRIRRDVMRALSSQSSSKASTRAFALSAPPPQKFTTTTRSIYQKKKALSKRRRRPSPPLLSSSSSSSNQNGFNGILTSASKSSSNNNTTNERGVLVVSSASPSSSERWEKSAHGVGTRWKGTFERYKYCPRRLRRVENFSSSSEFDEDHQVSNTTTKSGDATKKNTIDVLARALELDQKVTGKVEAVNRGGLILRVMNNKYRAFLPKSQMRSSRLKFCKTMKEESTEAEVMKQQIGNLIEVKFVEVTPKRVVCSEKSLIQENAEKKLPVGTQQRVVVTNLSDFGAFVEVIGEENNDDDNLSPVGLEGLIHISELSWNKVAHPRDVCRVGDELEVKVLEVANSGQRVNFSAKQMLDDPLMETLDTIMPVTMPELSFDDSESAFTNGDFDGEEGTKMEASLPGLPRICAELLSEDGVEAVIPGRTAVERRVVSQDLELWLTNVQVEDGYNLLARSGRQVQETHVVTNLNREAIKRAIKRATRATNA